ncbi:MAG: hypothetical protein M3N07_07205 [Pseudomonadota bacterium]|nr:hypothetical protein [Pseudomonadota bacterium]
MAEFYLDEARKAASRTHDGDPGTQTLVSNDEIAEAFATARSASERRGDEGVRQREFLNILHKIAEAKIQGGGGA